MTAKGRILAIKLSEKLKKNSAFAEKVGVEIDFKEIRSAVRFTKNVSQQPDK